VRLCWNKQLRTDLVDEAVWEEVCRLLEHPERLEQEYRRRLVQEEKTPDELSSLEARMGRLRQGIARLIDSYADGLIDKGEFEPRIARMRERLMHIEEQTQQIKDEASLERELTLILGRLDEFATHVKDGLHAADWLTRRETIRALVKRVEIDQEQVRVVFRVNPPPQVPQLPSEKDAQSLQHCRRRVLARTRQYDPGWTREKGAGEIPKAPSKIQQRESQLHPFCRRLYHYWQVQRGVRRRGQTARGAIYERTGARTLTGKDPHHSH
jgi:site-specific DNA recombinase